MSWGADTLAAVKHMATSGAGEEAIALELKLPRADVRTIAGLLGVSLEALDRGEWCDRCCSWRSSLDSVTGWCPICTERHKLEQQREADAAEEDRLRREAMREDAATRKARQRMREEFGANPRKGKAAE